MNGTFYQIAPLGTELSSLSPLYFAQDNPLAVPLDLNNLKLGQTSVVDIALACGILLVGYLIALFAQSLVKSLFKKTDLDNRIAAWVSGSTAPEDKLPVEDWLGTTIFWIIFIFAIVAFLDKLQLTAASTPLTSLLNQVTNYLPRMFGAAVLIAIAWILATIARTLLIRVFRAFRLDERLNQQVNDAATDQFSLSETLGNALYWFIILLFLPAILSTLQLQGLLEPVQQMLYQILSILPNIVAALVIAGAGWLVAQVVSRIVTNLLAAVGIDQFGSRLGLNRLTGNQRLSSLIGLIVYILILIPTAISALQTLKVEAISGPAILMLTEIFNALPQIFLAISVLIVAYLIGRFVADLVTNILTSIGFDNIFRWLGIHSPQTPLVEERIITEETIPTEPTVSPVSTRLPQNTPSELVGIIVLVGIMLFAAVTATDILGLAALTLIINQIIVIAGKVLIGIIVFAIGLYFANLAHDLIVSSGTRQSNLLAQAARIAIIIFVGAMALQQMGIASDIVNLAFGLLLGAVAVAIAIAFGLGGRDVAGEQLRNFLSKFRE
ncbi:mechanosensitive ion channel [Planktothrix mougeotii]|uniref:Mechanosensitive ion channel n=1 Tax=Planktothrix mougeotii LEGE 06226 TaxID=1828728 RepID=A0ABR9UBI4_9CYAN|nr:mechanosensitive ion channel [Planktothrix mougeotii]MBE9143813.1 mechanosensitive ion channel [Planktothrix mougeotii LEGE 06226]